MKKSVIFVADSLDNAHKFQQVLSALDVEVAAGSSLQFKNLLVKHPGYDLVIYEARGDVAAGVAAAEDMLVADGNGTLLVILSEEQLADFVPPARVRSDFVMRNATAAECTVRVRQLLWPGSEQTTASCVTVDAMTIDLATYQVEVDGEPLDLTYLEYALLAFLATHPGRTYSRDALLRHVWGFDYYGGSRTVDVHVRRIRAKLGPELAQHLETVRGVGYLWN